MPNCHIKLCLARYNLLRKRLRTAADMLHADTVARSHILIPIMGNDGVHTFRNLSGGAARRL